MKLFCYDLLNLDGILPMRLLQGGNIFHSKASGTSSFFAGSSKQAPQQLSFEGGDSNDKDASSKPV